MRSAANCPVAAWGVGTEEHRAPMTSKAVDVSDPVEIARWLRTIATELRAADIFTRLDETKAALNVRVMDHQDLVVNEAAGAVFYAGTGCKTSSGRLR
jgi:hypothetical protein